jgi:hypothetical protein
VHRVKHAAQVCATTYKQTPIIAELAVTNANSVQHAAQEYAPTCKQTPIIAELAVTNVYRVKAVPLANACIR